MIPADCADCFHNRREGNGNIWASLGFLLPELRDHKEGCLGITFIFIPGYPIHLTSFTQRAETWSLSR